jgi:hypothetical protein
MPPSLGSYSSSSNVTLAKKRGPKLVHGRSLSHIQPSKLNAPGGGASLRPQLGRSKSTDGFTSRLTSHPSTGSISTLTRPNGPLKKNPRSFTKPTGLQPLTKLTLNPLIKSSKSNSSLKGLTVGGLNGLKSSARKGRAVLRLNDDDNDFEDTGSPPDDPAVQQAPPPPPPSAPSPQAQPPVESSKSDPPQDVAAVPDTQAQSSFPSSKAAHPDDAYLYQSSEDLSNNVYGGLLLLSQSTGLTKKIDNTIKVAADAQTGDLVHHVPLRLTGSANSDSQTGISFNANPIDGKVAEPIITTKTVEPVNSYQPSQTILNNLQRTRNPAATRAQSTNVANQEANDLNANNFQYFLKNNNLNQNHKTITTAGVTSAKPDDVAAPNPSHHDNRTQQRLWLQRENSLMDINSIDPTQLANLSSLSLNHLMFSHQGGLVSDHLHMPPPHQHQHQHHQQPHQLQLQLQLRLQKLQQQQQLLQQHQQHQVSTPTAQVIGGPVNLGLAPSESTSSLYGLFSNIQSSQQNSIQSRTEFERLNREYLNVRRHLNPVGESLNRTKEYLKSVHPQQIPKTRKQQLQPASEPGSMSPSVTANTFKDFSPSFHEKEAETTMLINRIWQTAVISTSTSSSPLLNTPSRAMQLQHQLSSHPQLQLQLQLLLLMLPQLLLLYQAQGLQHQLQLLQQSLQSLQHLLRPHNQRLQSYTQPGYTSLRSPQTPTTRAVKLATASQQSFKKSDNLVSLA